MLGNRHAVKILGARDYPGETAWPRPQLLLSNHRRVFSLALSSSASERSVPDPSNMPSPTRAGYDCQHTNTCRIRRRWQTGLLPFTPTTSLFFSHTQAQISHFWDPAGRRRDLSGCGTVPGRSAESAVRKGTMRFTDRTAREVWVTLFTISHVQTRHMVC